MGWGGGGYCDFYLLHRLTLCFGGSKVFNLLFGLFFSNYILGYANLGGYFLRYVIFDRYFWGVRFQNKTFCNVILMYSLIKCSI